MNASRGATHATGSQFLRFCCIGALGFTVDALVLLLLIHSLGMSPFAARVLSILVALTVTWVLHRSWTFRTANANRMAEWLRFAVVNGFGGGLNYLVYAAILVALPGTSPLVALVGGSAAALVANFLGSKFWAFRTGRATIG